MSEKIEYIDKNTRRRNGKLERKDPITGVWVLHPIQFWHDYNMEETMDKIYKQQEKDRLEMFKPIKAEEFLKKDVAEYDEDAKFAKVKKVLDVTMPFHFKESRIEIVFEGNVRDKAGRYIAGCWAYSGDFYEPPSEECWFEDLNKTLDFQEKRLKHNLEVDHGWDVEKRQRIPFKEATSDQLEAEKRRLESIYSKDIQRIEYLRRFKER
jgi:hypothetical protein